MDEERDLEIDYLINQKKKGTWRTPRDSDRLLELLILNHKER